MSNFQKVEEKLMALGDSFNFEKITDGLAVISAKDYENMEITSLYNDDSISFSIKLKEVPSNVIEKNETNEKLLIVMGSGLIPLSTFSIINENGVAYYSIDGKIASESKYEMIQNELNMLLTNAVNIIEELI